MITNPRTNCTYLHFFGLTTAVTTAPNQPSRTIGSRSRMQPPVLLYTGTPRREHVMPILGQLHRLPVGQHIRYKLATLAFRSLSGQAPAYLTDDCQLVAESGRRLLRSVERSVCNNTFVLRRQIIRSNRSACVERPPATLRNTDLTMNTFCEHLKTVLFTDSWGRGAFVTF